MNTPLIVAHRGASYDAPENTLAAFHLAFEQGADAIEGDFHLTADGEVVCIHDGRTGRCGDRDLVVAQSTLAELRTVDVGTWKSPLFRRLRISTLAEVLAVVPERKGIFIELKTGAEIVPAVCATIGGSNVAPSQLRFISFDPATLAACRSMVPAVARNWLLAFRRDAAGAGSPDLPTILKTLADCGADGLGTEANLEVVTPAFAAALREAGVGLHAWTIDDEETFRAFAAFGADSITTNRPAAFVGRSLSAH